jgi:acetoin utilization deacetylase AcuC-like enzyme
VSGYLATSAIVGAPSTRRHFLQTLAVGVGASALLGESSWAGVSNQQRMAIDRLPTALVYDEISKSHVPPPRNPDCPQRYDAVASAITKSRYFSALKPYQSRPVTEAEILAVHSAAYVGRAQKEIESGARRLSTGDTWVCRKSFAAAHYAAGAACVGVDAVLSGQAKNAFCLTRPPGHHATANRGMGFCVFNNAAIAARYAQRKYHVGKVLIVDWDVHHGNGTQDIFYDDGSVFYFSTHESPWYPWTGRKDETGCGNGLGTTLNCPMLQGTGRKEFIDVFENELAPAVDRFKPDLVIISAGFDARQGDPLGRLKLSDHDYDDLTGLVLEMAWHHAEGRVVSVLEGGYSLTGLAAAAVMHCGRLQKG